MSGRAGYAKWTSAKDTATGPARRSTVVATAVATAPSPPPPPPFPLRGENAASRAAAPQAPSPPAAPVPVGPGTRSMTANTRRAAAGPADRAGNATCACAAPKAASTIAKKARSMSSKASLPSASRVPPYQKARA